MDLGSFGLTPVPIMKEDIIKTFHKEKALLNSVTELFTMANGMLAKFMDKGPTRLPAETNMLASTRMIRRMALERLPGLMERNTKEIGRMTHTMERALISSQMVPALKGNM